VSRGEARWREHALHELSSAGHRQGRGRRAIIDLLATQPCALTALDIEAELRRADHRVGLATVYRTLDLLAELKLVGRLETGQGIARYEPLLPSGEHHHHLVCDRCGRVIPFDDPDLEATMERVARRVRFEVAEHDVVLHGACGSCRN
jgi:Fur family transcriptional regulator, ferric uptake regulator